MSRNNCETFARHSTNFAEISGHLTPRVSHESVLAWMLDFGGRSESILTPEVKHRYHIKFKNVRVGASRTAQRRRNGAARPGQGNRCIMQQVASCRLRFENFTNASWRMQNRRQDTSR